MHFELHDKTFYKKTLRLMAPVVLQQLISVGVNFMDNLMIGGLGEAAISASSFSNQFYSLFQFICMGLGSGAVVLSSQLWGKRELESMRRAAAIALRLTAVLCALFTVVTVACPHVILDLFTKEHAVVQVGSPYLRLLGVTFLLSGLASTATFLLRSTGAVTVPLVGSAVAFVLNIFFNWVFIHGRLGAPALGLVGAAVGTVIARVMEFLIVFGHFILRDTQFGFRFRHVLLSGGALWKPYFKFGLPVLVSDTLLGISLVLITVIMGNMSSTVSAANAMVDSVVHLISIANAGMAGAAAIVIGNTIGMGDLERAKREGNSYMLLSFGMGFVLSGILFLLMGPYFAQYTVAEETLALARRMLTLICIWMPLQANAYVSSKGVLRGGGDTRFILVADSALLWFIALPMAALTGLVWKTDPIVPFLFLRMEYPVKGIVCLVRYCTGKWVKEISVKKVPAENQKQA